MGKSTNTVKKAPNRDHYARLSYLFQASSKLVSNKDTKEFSRFYNQVLKSVARKNVLRLSPAIKRQLCKNCNQFLIPGYTCTIRIENKSKTHSPNNDVYTVNCMLCNKQKRFPIGKQPNYELWNESVEFEELA